MMDKIHILEDLDESQLIRLINKLSNYESIYEISCSYEVEPFEFIYYYYRKGSIELKEKLKKAVFRIISEWVLSKEERDLNILYTSLKLGSLTSTFGLSKRLISFAKDEFLKSLTSYQEELHFILLKTLLQSIMVDSLEKEQLNDLKDIINRDIIDINYVGICFRLAWELSFEFGFEKIIDLVDLYIKNNMADYYLYLEMKEYIKHYGEKNFCEQLLSYYEKMEEQLRKKITIVFLYHLITHHGKIKRIEDIEKKLREKEILREIDYSNKSFSVRFGLTIEDYKVRGSWIRLYQNSIDFEKILQNYPNTRDIYLKGKDVSTYISGPDSSGMVA
jgi:hypothetical protein